jgi:hypothetical protein
VTQCGHFSYTAVPDTQFPSTSEHFTKVFTACFMRSYGNGLRIFMFTVIKLSCGGGGGHLVIQQKNKKKVKHISGSL